MKKFTLILITGILLCFSCENAMAQAQQSTADFSGNTLPIKNNSKHEVGFAVGAFPIIGVIIWPDQGFNIHGIDGHTYYDKRDEDHYQKMYQLGSYTFNYNYHFNSKHSVGGSISWVGKHIDKYWVYSTDFFGIVGIKDTVNGSGWHHFFTLQGNYRYTYYHKNKISLYFGAHWGITLCVRDKDILPKEPISDFLSIVSNKRCYLAPAGHINAFGIEIGTKYVFNMELGIGTQGIVKAGFRYKFDK